MKKTALRGLEDEDVAVARRKAIRIDHTGRVLVDVWKATASFQRGSYSKYKQLSGIDRGK